MMMADHRTYASLVLEGPVQHRPRAARRWVVARCGDLELELTGADLPLLVSELVTNACNHGADPVTVRLSLGSTTVRIEVEDSYPGLPEVRHPDEREERGRGMLIVDSLTRGWGAENTPTGKVVWAEIPRRLSGPRDLQQVGGV